MVEYLSETAILQLAGLASYFAAQPETLGQFVQWATKKHNENTPECLGDCFFSTATVENWHDCLLAVANVLKEGVKERG